VWRKIDSPHTSRWSAIVNLPYSVGERGVVYLLGKIGRAGEHTKKPPLIKISLDGGGLLFKQS
jgi:hypothetical protein